jgi:hypothetical protein
MQVNDLQKPCKYFILFLKCTHKRVIHCTAMHCILPHYAGTPTVLRFVSKCTCNSNVTDPQAFRAGFSNLNAVASLRVSHRQITAGEGVSLNACGLTNSRATVTLSSESLGSIARQNSAPDLHSSYRCLYTANATLESKNTRMSISKFQPQQPRSLCWKTSWKVLFANLLWEKNIVLSLKKYGW